MRKIISLLAVGLLVGLAGCNTVGGFGKDLQTGGQAVTNEAQEAQRSM